MPALSRRAVLIGSAAAIAPVVACAPPTRPDPELTALGARFEQALRTQQAAQRHFNDCESRYLDQCPDVPGELTRAGPLGGQLCLEDPAGSPASCVHCCAIRINAPTGRRHA